MAAEDDLMAIEQLIIDLQSQLEDANKTIAALQQQVDSLSSGKTVDDIAEDSYASKLKVLTMRYVAQPEAENLEITNQESL